MIRTPHKHAELIKAWADGARVQVCHGSNWFDCNSPEWNIEDEYRIKPEPKPEKRKTLGEICEDAFDLGFRGNDAAKAVADAIIERYLNDWQCMDEIAAAIRKEFEE